MKKKNVIIILIAILIVTITSILFTYKKDDKVFEKDGVLFALTLDGLAISDFPDRGDYRVEIDCNNAIGKWLPKEWKFVLEDIKGKVSCNLDFYSNPKTMVETIESFPKVKLTQSDYSTTSYYSSSYSSTSGTNVTNAFDYTNNEWISIPVNLTSSRYYHLRMNVPSTDYYELCYKLSKGASGNYFYLYNGSTRMNINGSSYLNATPETEQSGCVDLGIVTGNVRVVQRAYKNSKDGIATLNFYLKRSSLIDQGDAGFRYFGTNPGNYVWFNNEMWRIIGSIPTKVDSLGTTNNLIKIIKNEPIASLAYDAKSSSSATGIWGNNTLYTLLNSYYYGAKNGTNSSYCYVSGTNTKTNCDYTVSGISPSEYYGKMVKKVYWNTGAVVSTGSSLDAFNSEAKTQNIQGYVGLMTFSDHAYSFSATYNVNHNEYKQWLHKYAYEWFSTANANDTSEVWGTYSDHYREYSAGNYRLAINMLTGLVVRPVVYLDETVYIVSGDGTEENPYQLSM